jgi:hypothetical protein
MNTPPLNLNQPMPSLRLEVDYIRYKCCWEFQAVEAASFPKLFLIGFSLNLYIILNLLN